MEKKFHRVLIGTLCLLVALLSGAVHAEQALLWRVESAQGVTSHLFGTIHSEDQRVTDLPGVVEQAFAQAETVVLEIEPAAEAQGKMARAIMLPPAQQLSDLVPSELYRDAISAMAERGYPESFTARLHPWAVLLTLSMPQSKTGQFLDKVLYDRAIEQGKAIQGLESVDEQLAIFRELSLADQQVLLEQTLQDYQQLPELMEAMTRAWLERDMDQLVALNRENMEGLPEALRQRFGRRLMEERNHRMAERALALLQQGGVFIAVGAMHLPGEEGLVALLREQGMTLTPVY